MSVLAYLRRDGKTLMLHRNKKEGDVHWDKWNGLGGKMEKGEMPEETLKREIFEESGFVVRDFSLEGVITFPDFVDNQDWLVFLYNVTKFDGKMIKKCDEGELHWVEDEKILQLNMWQGDYLFFEWMQKKCFFSAKIVYLDGCLADHSVFFYPSGQ